MKGFHQARTLRDLYNDYFASPQFKELSPRTQLDYVQLSRKVLDSFGAMTPDELTAPKIREYMDSRVAKVRANRERTVLQIVLAWGMERGHNQSNAASDVKPFKERGRTRYVSDDEMDAVLEVATASVRTAMLLSYLCAARQQDVLRLRWDHIDDKRGIYIKQGKTGKEQWKLWTSDLRMVVIEASNLLSRYNGKRISSMYVVHTRQGQPYTSSGFKTMFIKARDAALKKGTLKESFTFHDLKHKSITDYQGDKRRFSGHMNDAMVRRYDHSVEEVATLDLAKRPGRAIRANEEEKQ